MSQDAEDLKLFKKYFKTRSDTFALQQRPKKNGKTLEKDGIIYEYVGDDMVLNTKTNRIEKI